jgi:Flp pilus assembly protein TadB
MTQHESEKLQDASLGELTGQLSRQVSRLVRDEMRLAQLEMTQKGKRLGVGAGLMWAGAMLAVFGLGCLVATAVLALDTAWAAWLSALVVGIALFVAAGLAILAGRGQLRRGTPPVPSEAVASTKEDLQALKGHQS